VNFGNSMEILPRAIMGDQGVIEICPRLTVVIKFYTRATKN
jgi:hypothetical protein